MAVVKMPSGFSRMNCCKAGMSVTPCLALMYILLGIRLEKQYSVDRKGLSCGVKSVKGAYMLYDPPLCTSAWYSS